MSAEEIINLRNRELNAQLNIRSLWQDTADHIYPYIDINSESAIGSRRNTEIYDQTAMLDAEDMVSGLKYILIPSGQPFFSIQTGRDVVATDVIRRYVSMLTETAHEKIFLSNFITELDEVLRSLIIFGPASLFSEWTVKTGLNYKNCIVGSYQFLENSKRLVDGVVITVQYTPGQAKEEFGDNAGPEVLKALTEPKRANELFKYIYLVRPRTVNRTLSQSYSGNMPWEYIVVNEKEKIEVETGGFHEFPYHSARWKRPCNEKHGRGVGTEILPQVKYVDKIKENFIDVGNFHAKPAWQKHESIEGKVRVVPGAMVTVREMDHIKRLDAWNGNYNETKDILTMEREVIHRAFFKNAFSPLEDLTGDRRTTLEIRERIKQSWPKIGPPVARVWYELLENCITRSILLLIRNGEVPQPPAELQGRNFGIEFVGPFALELRSQQARAFQEWAAFVGEMDTVFPGAVDNVDSDDAIVRMGRTFGVNEEDIATTEERDEKREERARRLQQKEMVEAAQAGAQAYQSATKAPEEGSPAELIGV
jgi:hypothetical protein